MQATLITDVAKEIAARKGITISHAYKEARKQQLQDGFKVPEGWSKKDYLLEAVLRLNSNSGVNADTIAKTLKAMGVPMTLPEVNSVCWDLQKQQLIIFQESHTSRGSVLTRIRLTSDGRKRISEKRELAGSDVGIVVKKRRSPHPVGTDMTSPENHKATAVGGPVEVIVEAKPPVEIIPAPVYSAQEKAPAKEPVQIQMLLAGYPALRALIQRSEEKKAARAKAATVVEAASLVSDVDPEAAEILMERAAAMEGPQLSSLEREMLAFIDELKAGAN